MMAYLQQAAFFDECTEDGKCFVTAAECGVGGDVEWMLMAGNSSRPAVLATLRGGLSARKFATLDAAFKLCRHSVPSASGVELVFRVVAPGG